ncbi:nucleotide pyrophosphohydrolase [Hutsoniella sourekii]|uniref:nucleotide pyrophosphohydrolase n=1 Tax=Hutsoniella sourekii TaxID=87650 RepID=UPI0004891862|nr:nucleotide pyrophosphohydrolase [Hutsoniella sourekii]
MNLMEKVDQFRDERDWRQFHNEKDLALSISLEAAELLEIFQWKTSQEAIDSDLDHLKEELADVMIYSLMLASNLNLDLEEIVIDKLAKNAEKYPVDKAKGNKKKYDHLN